MLNVVDSDRHLHRLNIQPAIEAEAEFLKCCGSTVWANRMTEARPFGSVEQLAEVAERIWWSLQPEDWLESFNSHPKIGERKTESSAHGWSEQEQSGVKTASDDTKVKLADLNREYEKKFGYIFIICATGKTSDEMLSSLQERLQHSAEKELHIAAAEQAKITALRLGKLLNS